MKKRGMGQKKAEMVKAMPDAYKRKTSDLGRMRIRPVKPKMAYK
jgi:hypothetical protein